MVTNLSGEAPIIGVAHYLCGHHRTTMSHNKIIPTGRQKMIFVVHLLAFLVGVTIMFLIHAGQEKAARAWVYPWHAWIIAPGALL
jgi:hypothetical protein